MELCGVAKGCAEFRAVAWGYLRWCVVLWGSVG